MRLPRVLTAALCAATMVLAGCAGDDLAQSDAGGAGGGGGGGAGELTLASQSFDEAALVTAMYQLLLENEGYQVETKLVDTRPAYLSQFPGEVDVVPEYVAPLAGQLNTDLNGENAEPVTSSDLQQTLQAMQPLLAEKGITLLEPSEAASQNAYFVTEEYAEQNDVAQLSDLEGETVTLAAAPDCKGRADCLQGLREVYGIDVSLLPLGYASPQTYQAVQEGEAQLGQTGTLDGTLEEKGLVLLEDDRDIQPPGNLVPAVGTEFLADNPQVEQPLNDLMGALDNDTLAGLVARVTVDREKPENVARDFLTEQGML